MYLAIKQEEIFLVLVSLEGEGMIQLEKKDFRKVEIHTMVWNVDGKEYLFTKSTAEDAKELKEGTILVWDDEIYICRNAPKGLIKSDEHLCESCSCERFFQCDKVLKKNEANINDHMSFIKKGFETKENYPHSCCIILECSEYEEGADR